jgi:hypothetical protein
VIDLTLVEEDVVLDPAPHPVRPIAAAAITAPAISGREYRRPFALLRTIVRKA